MAVPPFHEMMLPVLMYASDGQEHRLPDLRNWLGHHLGLSEEDLTTPLPSGESRFRNRAYWARMYLGRAGLLESTGWGRFKITQRGKELLATKPSKIDIALLKQYPEFLVFIGEGTGEDTPQAVEDLSGEDESTPEERINSGYKALRETLATSLLEKVLAGSPSFFEHLVIELLLAMGYGGSREDAGKAVGKSGDEGIDGIIKQDRLGLDLLYIQAKRWDPKSGRVGRPVVQAFVGALAGKGASKGVMIATTEFSKEAKEYADKVLQQVVLIGGQELATLMIEHNVGVVKTALYEIKRLDLDYFEEE